MLATSTAKLNKMILFLLLYSLKDIKIQEQFIANTLTTSKKSALRTYVHICYRIELNSHINIYVVNLPLLQCISTSPDGAYVLVSIIYISVYFSYTHLYNRHD
jgi:hypothetical protein